MRYCHIHYAAGTKPFRMVDSVNLSQQLRLQNEFVLLVPLGWLVGSIVLPADVLLALTARYVTDDVFSGRHAAFLRFPLNDVYYLVKKEGFAMLTAEVLKYYVSVYRAPEVCSVLKCHLN